MDTPSVRYDFTSLKPRIQEVAERELGAPEKVTRSEGEPVLWYRCPVHGENTASFAVYADHGFCFACGWTGDTVDLYARLHLVGLGDAARRLGAGERDEAATLAYRQHRETQQAEEAARRSKLRDRHAEAQTWKIFHDGMGQGERETWRRAGVPDEFQDRWAFGYTPARSYEYGQAYFHAPALTIPCLSWRNGVPPQFQTMQYRLLGVPKEHGKYRTEEGLGTSAWIARPDLHPGDWGRVLVVEGAKKAAATYVALRKSKLDIQVAAVPAQRDWGGIVEALGRFDEVIVWLDPGIERPPANAKRGWLPADVALCKTIGTGKACYVRYEYKIDDAINEFGLTGKQIESIIRYTRRYPK